MEETLLTIDEAKQFFRVKDTRTIQKFVKQGLKCFKVGQREWRFSKRDILEFVERQKEISQMEIDIQPVKRKTRHKQANVDFEKRKINLEMNRVI